MCTVIYQADIPKEKPILIVGTGSHADFAFERLNHGGFNIAGFLDFGVLPRRSKAPVYVDLSCQQLAAHTIVVAHDATALVPRNPHWPKVPTRCSLLPPNNCCARLGAKRCDRLSRLDNRA